MYMNRQVDFIYFFNKNITTVLTYRVQNQYQLSLLPLSTIEKTIDLFHHHFPYKTWNSAFTPLLNMRGALLYIKAKLPANIQKTQKREQPPPSHHFHHTPIKGFLQSVIPRAPCWQEHMLPALEQRQHVNE